MMLMYLRQKDKEKAIIDLHMHIRENNLYISGGSDYHGNPKPNIEIGVGRGSLNIARTIIEEWINK